MNVSFRTVLRFAVATVVSTLIASGAQSAAHPPSLSTIYLQLKAAVEKGRELGFSDALNSQIRELRSGLSRDDSGMEFLIAKLESMNQRETGSGKAGAGDCEAIFAETAVLDAVMDDAPLKFELFEALAEGYDHASPKLKKQVLQVLESSYTPAVACDTHGGRSVLDLALWRIGRDSVPTLLRLSERSQKSVRCGADDFLNELGKRQKKDITAAPVLNCENEGASAQQVERWRQWWGQNSTAIDIPKLPDFGRQ